MNSTKNELIQSLRKDIRTHYAGTASNSRNDNNLLWNSEIKKFYALGVGNF